MSERTETEIKSLTKEQNYMLGYQDGRTDVLDRVKQAREEIENLEVQIQSYHNDNPMISQSDVLAILDKLITKSEGK